MVLASKYATDLRDRTAQDQWVAATRWRPRASLFSRWASGYLLSTARELLLFWILFASTQQKCHIYLNCVMATLARLKLELEQLEENHDFIPCMSITYFSDCISPCPYIWSWAAVRLSNLCVSCSYLLAITRLEVGQTKVAECVSSRPDGQNLAWKCDKESLRTISKYPNEYAWVPLILVCPNFPQTVTQDSGTNPQILLR